MAGVFPATASADAKLLLATRALRGFADGAVSIILPSYLIALGFGSFQIGTIVFGMLLGSAILTLWVGLASIRVATRRVLLGASLLMLLTGIGFYIFTGFWPLFVVALVGTLNPSAGDVSLFLPAEQTALSETVSTRDLTSIFAMYNVSGALAGALGALASGLPAIVAARFGWQLSRAERFAFLVYSLIAVVAAIFYARLPEKKSLECIAGRGSALTTSRRVVIKLSALFSIDAFGGGFVVQSLLALWLFHRFGMKVGTAGTFFFEPGCWAPYRS